jgi:hypothetical protein
VGAPAGRHNERERWRSRSEHGRACLLCRRAWELANGSACNGRVLLFWEGLAGGERPNPATWVRETLQSACSTDSTRRRSGQSTNGHAPLSPQRRPFRPHFMHLFRGVLTRSRSAEFRKATHFLAYLTPPGRPRGPLPPSNCAKIAGAGGVDPPRRPPPAPLRGTWAGLRPAQSP